MVVGMAEDYAKTGTVNVGDALENGIKDADSSKLNPHSKARKIFEKWL